MTTTATSKSLLSWDIPIAPVPASRPRVPRFGKPYYVGKYKVFRTEFGPIIDQVCEDISHEVYDHPLQVSLGFVCYKPAKPANSFPNGDIDNYVKAALDQMNGKLFVDDKLVTTLVAWKRYTQEGESPHIKLEILDGRST